MSSTELCTLNLHRELVSMPGRLAYHSACKAVVLGSLATAGGEISANPPSNQPTQTLEEGSRSPPHKAALQLHAGLPKAYISILTQIHTGKIGLAAFLRKCQVPGFESVACPCR